jgi:hypothetical protein
VLPSVSSHLVWVLIKCQLRRGICLSKSHISFPRGLVPRFVAARNFIPQVGNMRALPVLQQSTANGTDEQLELKLEFSVSELL